MNNGRKRKLEKEEYANQENPSKRRKLDYSIESKIDVGNEEEQELKRLLKEAMDSNKKKAIKKKATVIGDNEQNKNKSNNKQGPFGPNQDNSNDNNANNNGNSAGPAPYNAFSGLNNDGQQMVMALRSPRDIRLHMDRYNGIDTIGESMECHYNHGGTKIFQKCLFIVESKDELQKICYYLRTNYVWDAFCPQIYGGMKEKVSEELLKTAMMPMSTVGRLEYETRIDWKYEALKENMKAVIWLNKRRLKTQRGYKDLRKRLESTEWSKIDIYLH